MVTLIIPLFNERETLWDLYRRIIRVFASLQLSFEIIFVDDGSMDGSFEVLEKIHSQDTRVRVISFLKNCGKSSALSAGFEKASGDIIITLDADLQDQPEEIPRFIDTIHKGYDLVSGWKRQRCDPFINVVASKIFNRAVSLLFQLKIRDVNSGFKAYRSEALKDLDIYGELHRFLPIILRQKGFQITEIEVHHAPRMFGKSKYGIIKFVHGFIDLFTVLLLTKYIQRPAHFFGTLGVISFSAGFFVNLYLTIKWFMGFGIGNRPLFLLGILLLIIGIQLISFGLLGEILVNKNRKKNYQFKKIL